jgi:hypothetical protein
MPFAAQSELTDAAIPAEDREALFVRKPALRIRTARADPTPWLCRKHHDLADDLLLGPRGCDASCPHRSDAIYFPQRSGSASMTSNTFSPKARSSFLA